MSNETDRALADLDGERMRLVVQRDEALAKIARVAALAASWDAHVGIHASLLDIHEAAREVRAALAAGLSA